jgi:hypothetical protein
MPDDKVSSWAGAATAVVAVGVVGLYIVGISKTVGQLRASCVDVSDGLSVIPLERHLRVAIGIVGDPRALVPLLVIGVGCLFLPMMLAYVKARSTHQNPFADATPPLVVGLGVMLLCILTNWALTELSVLTMFGSWAVVFVIPVLVGSWYVWTKREGVGWERAPRMVVLYALVTAVVSGVFYFYFVSDPFSEAYIQTPGHSHTPGYVHRHVHRYGKISGPLIVNTDGVLFVGSRDGGTHKQVAIGRARSVRVEKRTREEKPTGAEAFAVVLRFADRTLNCR